MTNEEQLINRIWTRAYLDTKESHIQLLKDYAQEKTKALYTEDEVIESIKAVEDAKDKEMDELIEIHHAQDEDLKKQFESLESELSQLREGLDGKSKTCADLTVLLSEEKVKANELREENIKLQNHIHHDTSKIIRFESELAKYKEQIERFKNPIKNAPF